MLEYMIIALEIKLLLSLILLPTVEELQQSMSDNFVLNDYVLHLYIYTSRYNEKIDNEIFINLTLQKYTYDYIKQNCLSP